MWVALVAALAESGRSTAVPIGRIAEGGKTGIGFERLLDRIGAAEVAPAQAVDAVSLLSDDAHQMSSTVVRAASR